MGTAHKKSPEEVASDLLALSERASRNARAAPTVLAVAMRLEALAFHLAASMVKENLCDDTKGGA